MNVYCCLVCGKYFRGRGKSTEAHTHSVEVFHHVYMNLHNAKIYCLPGESVRPSVPGAKPPTHPHQVKTNKLPHPTSTATTADNYEVVDSSLDDIKRALFPTFSPPDIARLDANTTLVRDVHGVSYLPGESVSLVARSG